MNDYSWINNMHRRLVKSCVLLCLFGLQQVVQAQSPVVSGGQLSVSGQVWGMSEDDVPGSMTLSISGGAGAYTISWSHQPLPTPEEVIGSLSEQFEGSLPDNVSENQIREELNALSQLSAQNDLMPNAYYARVQDPDGNTAYVAGLVSRYIHWQGKEGTIDVTGSWSEQRTIDGVTWLPAQGNTIQKTQGGGLENGYSISREFLYPDDYNYIEFEVPPPGGELRTGLAVVDNEAPWNIDDMRYYIRFYGEQAQLYSNGSALGEQFTYTEGDVFGIETKNGNLVFYRNYQPINPGGDAIVLPEDQAYQYKNMMENMGAVISQLKVVSLKGGLSNPTGGVNAQYKDRVTAVITDATCSNNCSGSIRATASMLMQSSLFGPRITPYSFEIYKAVNGLPLGMPLATFTNLLGFSATFSNLCPGDYYVRFTYLTGKASSILDAVFTVAYMPDWLGITNTNVDPVDRSLSKNTVIETCDAGAFSANELAYSTDTEWFEFGAHSGLLLASSGLFDDVHAGLTASSSNLVTTASQGIQYGIAANLVSPSIYPGNVIGQGTGTGWFYVFTNTPFGLAYIGYNLVANDRFRIAKTGNTLRFYRNNTLLSNPPSLTVSGNTPMRADVSLCVKAASLVKPRMSFSCFTPMYAMLQKEKDGQCYRVDRNKLYFKYDEEYQDTDGKLQFNVYNDRNDKVINSATLPASLVPAVSYGDNRYVFDLSNTAYSGGALLAEGYYTLEVINEKNESYYLRFKK